MDQVDITPGFFGGRYRKLKFLEGGLLLADGNRWRQDRKRLNPSFASEAMYSMVNNFSRHTNDLVDFLAQNGRKDETSLNGIFSSLAFDIICSSGFGYESQTKKGEETKITQAVAVLMDELQSRMSEALPCHLLPQRFEHLDYCKPMYMQSFGARKNTMKKNLENLTHFTDCLFYIFHHCIQVFQGPTSEKGDARSD